MYHYYLIHWKRSGTEELLNKDAFNIDHLISQLAIEFPDEEILIHNHNFHYVTHISHCLAAGYPIYIPSIAEALKPAHFNRDFFYILGTISIIK